MKKRGRALLAVILCLCMLMPLGLQGAAASFTTDDLKSGIKGTVSEVKDSAKQGSLLQFADVTDENGNTYSIFSKEGAKTLAKSITSFKSLVSVIWRYVHAVLATILHVLAGDVFTDTNRDRKYLADYESENFYPGTEEFSAEPGSGWRLGYANEVFTPEDLLTRPYYMGGYDIGKQAMGNLDDLKIRAVCLEDGSGRGVTAFAVIDTVGISNYDIRRIRAAVEQWAQEEGAQFNSVNVSVSHTHSGLDTQGIWASPLAWLNNIGSMMSEDLTPEGTDPVLLERVISCTSAAIRQAWSNMESGRLYYAEKNAAEYFNDKSDPDIILEDIHRLRFDPDNEASRETLIANWGAHPETVGLKTDDNPGDKISADYLYYTEEILNQYGYNFILIQGGLGSLISCSRGLSGDNLNINRYQSAVRYGWEMGYLLLGMTKTEEEIAAQLDGGSQSDLYEGRDSEGYTLWYENWEPVTETEVAPILNIAIREVVFEMDNPIIVAVGKLGFCTNNLLYGSGSQADTLYTVTEVGYMELGDSIKIAMMPGEVAPELIKGGKTMTAEGSVSGTDFVYDCLQSYYDDSDTVLVFDVMNDSTGYIVPDNDYGMITLRYDEDTKQFTSNTDGMLSFGTKAASTFIGAYMEIVTEKTGKIFG